MKLKGKIILLPTLATGCMLIILGVFASIGVRNNWLLTHIQYGHAPAVEISQDLERYLDEAQRTLQAAVESKEPSSVAEVEAVRNRILDTLVTARRNPTIDGARVDKLERGFVAYLDHAKATSLRMIKKEIGIEEDLEKMVVGYNALKETLRLTTQENKEASIAAFDEMRSVGISSQVIALVIVLACVGLLAFLSRRIIRQVLGPLGKLTSAAQKIAVEGDLTQSVSVESKDEIGQLAGAFATMVSQLQEVYSAIEVAVQKLAAAATQIFAASQEQEAASQTQSAGAEEVNRTMQSLLESATHIAESANGVFANAERTKETSVATAEKIAELSAQTARMVEILEVIREIADRSDLLALNASLEGTRAGEAGRGFSLVANEMRRLSERVTASVQDVKGLVTDIRASGASTVMVTEEARKLAEATAGSAKQITLVTQQQRTATELVSRNMKEVTNVLMQTVSSNRQTKRAAEDLSGQAERLTQIVRRFKIEAAKA